MKLINLTPHPIALRAPDGTDTIVPSSGRATVACEPGDRERVEGVPVSIHGANQYGAISGLPDEPEPDTLYVVSSVVGAAAREMIAAAEDALSRESTSEECDATWGRTLKLCRRLVMPGTGPQDGAVRDDQGRVVAVTRLVRV